jgi:membrane protein DedA with SNARE-associated domain
VVGAETHESSWKRWAVGIVVGLAVVVVALQLLDQGDLSGWLADVPAEVAYLLCFLLVWFDAVIPIFPGETTLSAASTMAAEGELELGYVMLAGALGAIVGDSSLFWIARTSRDRVQDKLDAALENRKVAIAWESLQRSPGLLIVAGRFVPGMRFAVDASMGLSDYPYRRFLPWSIVGGTFWSVYTCALAYAVATTLAGYPLASMVISGLITSAAIVAVFFVDRRRRRGSKGADAEPERAASHRAPAAGEADA